MLETFSLDFYRYVWPVYFSVSAVVLWSNYILSVLCERGYYPQITDLNLFIFVIGMAWCLTEHCHSLSTTFLPIPALLLFLQLPIERTIHEYPDLLKIQTDLLLSYRHGECFLDVRRVAV